MQLYDAQMRKGVGNEEMLRIFHGLKGIYIQSIISGDDALKIQVLERLIHSAKALRLDSSRYESELKLLRKEGAAPTLFASPPKTSSTPTSSKMPTTLPSQFKGHTVLHEVTASEEQIVLRFGEAVESSHVKVFGLSVGDGYKKVVDIPAVILNGPISIPSTKRFGQIRLSQYNASTIRLVLDAPKSFELFVSVLGNEVRLSHQRPQSIAAPKPTTPPLHPQKAAILPSKELSLAKVPAKVHHKTIVIDPGHGGKDRGATGHQGRIEKGLVLDIALELGRLLKSKGYRVHYTRANDRFINLRDRTKVANDKNADLFISLHANAAPTEVKRATMRGLETFFLSPDRSQRSKNVAALENQSDIEEMDFYSKETFLNVLNREKILLSNKAAIDLHAGMLKALRQKYTVQDGGVREAPFWVLVGAQMPAVLVEVGYISHPEESGLMFNDHYQKLMIQGMAEGIDTYFTNNP